MQEEISKPQIRFENFDNNWVQYTINEISNVYDGVHQTPDYKESGVMFLSVEDINSLISQKYISEESFNKDFKIYPQRGDILMTRIGDVGTTNVVETDEELAFYVSLALLKPINVNSYFLSNVIMSPRFKKGLQGRTLITAVPQKINKDEIGKIDVLIPLSLAEQTKIGVFFHILNKLIRHQKQKYTQLMNMKQTLLEKMFPRDGEKVPEIRFDGFEDDWVSCRLEEIVKQHNAGIYISKKNYGEGINIIGVGDIYDSDTIDGEIYRLAPVNDKRFILDENDLIYGESSLVPEGIARTMCVTEKGAGTAFAWHTRRFKIDNSILNSHFLTLELNYNRQVRNYLMNVSTQTALTGMTTDAYFGTSIIFPTLKEQERISKTFLELDNLISLQQRKIDQLKNIKHSFLDKMFVS